MDIRKSVVTVVVERVVLVTVLVAPASVTVTVETGDVTREVELGVDGDALAVVPVEVAVVTGGWVTMTEVAGSDPVQAASRGAARASNRTWRSGFVFTPISRATSSEVVRAA